MYRTYAVSQSAQALLQEHVEKTSQACNMSDYWEVADKVALNRGLSIERDGGTYKVLTDRITVSIPDTEGSPQDLSTEEIDCVVLSWLNQG